MDAKAVQNRILELSQSGRTGYFLALLISFPAMSLCAIDMYVSALPQIAIDFATTPTLVQLSMGSYMFGLAFFQLLLGPLSDYFGRKVLILYGVGLFVLASFACALPHHIALFIVARIFQAVGASAITGVARTLARDLFKGQALAKFMGNLSTAIQIFPMLSPMLGAYISHYLGWQAVFIVLGGFAALLWVVLYFFLPETNFSRKKGQPQVSRIIKGYRWVMAEPQLWIHASISGVAFGGSLAYYAVTPFLFQNVYHMSTILYGWLAFVVSMFVFFGKFTNTILLRRYSAHQVLSLGVLILLLSSAVLTLLSLLHCSGAYWIVSVFSLFTFGAGLILSNASSLALSAFHKNIGMASALYSATQIAFCTASNLITSHFHVQTPVPLALALLALSAIAGAALLYKRRITKESE